MDRQQIQELLSPYLEGSRLSSVQLEQVRVYLDLLMKWNAKMNLTAVRSEEEMVTRHFGESFFAAKTLLAVSAAESVIDLGSGAGFPGLPIAIYSTETKVTLIESQNKKATFLKEVVRSTELKNVAVFSGRGEEYAERAALVTLRAVEKFEVAARVAAGLVGPAGRLVLMIGAEQQSGLPEGFVWQVGKPIPGSERRVLVAGTRE